jgi:hypothetical protein
MSSSLERQDASAHMPLGVFLHGELVGTVTDQRRDPHGYEAVRRIAAERGIEIRGFEVLTLCHLHPTVSAVDCLDCEPVD